MQPASVRVDKDVLGLDVAVDEALRMDVLQCLHELFEQLIDDFSVETLGPTFVNPVSQCFAFRILHEYHYI